MKKLVVALCLLAIGFAVSAQDEPDEPSAKFVKITAEVGLADETPNRIYLHDLNGDGFPELIAQVADKEGPGNKGGVAQIYLNREGEDGRVFELDEKLTLAHNGEFEDGTRHASVFTVVGDFNNDNQPDLFRPVFQEMKDHEKHPDSGERSGIWFGDIKKNSVEFEYEEDAIVETDPTGTCAVALLDFDRDGSLDIFTGGWYVRYGVSYEGHVNRLYKGDGKGGFTDVTEEAGLLTVKQHAKAESSRPTYGVAACDYNGDGWQDLVVANYGRQWNRLWHNNGDGTFNDVGPELGVDGDDITHGKYPAWVKRQTEEPFRANGNTFSIVPADFDNDGDIDLFSSEITHGWAGESSDLSALLVNQGKEDGFKFKRVTEPFIREREDKDNWNQGDLMALWGDLDHDGLQDLVLASSAYPDNQRLRIFRQTAEHSFEDVSSAWGLDWPNCGHIAMDDIDGDGDLDIVGMGDTRFTERKQREIGVWRNDAGDGNWLKITLEGARGTNRFAYGAKVWVTAGDTTMLREVQSSAGHQGVAPSRTLHFGLGEAERVSIRIQWPNEDLDETEYEEVKVNRPLHIQQKGGIQD